MRDQQARPLVGVQRGLDVCLGSRTRSPEPRYQQMAFGSGARLAEGDTFQLGAQGSLLESTIGAAIKGA